MQGADLDHERAGADGVVDLGLVPEEVLLLAGRPGGASSRWWTPWLAALPPHDRTAVVERARQGLRDDGLLTADDRPSGAFAAIAEVVRGATAVTTFVTELPEGPTTRGSVVLADDVALLLVADPAHRGHRVQRCDLRTAVALLAVGIDPFATAREGLSPRVADTVVALDPHELEHHVPVATRRSTVRLAHVATGGPTSVELLCTVVAGADSLRLLRATPDGGLLSSEVRAEEVTDVAAALLGLTLVDA